MPTWKLLPADEEHGKGARLEDYNPSGELLPAWVTPRDRGPKTESLLMVGNEHL